MQNTQTPALSIAPRDRHASMRAYIARMQQRNQALRAENAQLKAQVTSLTQALQRARNTAALEREFGVQQ